MNAYYQPYYTRYLQPQVNIITALMYLATLINIHGIIYGDNVNLTDYEIELLFHKEGSGQAISQKNISLKKNILRELGIIFPCEDDEYIFKQKAHTWQVNMPILQNYLLRYNLGWVIAYTDLAKRVISADENNTLCNVKYLEQLVAKSVLHTEQFAGKPSMGITDISCFKNTYYIDFTMDSDFWKKVEESYQENWSKIRFGTNLRINRNTNDEYLYYVLNEKYPELKFLQGQKSMHNSNNWNDIYKKDLAKIKIHRSTTGMVTKISIRLTNPFCNLHSIKHQKNGVFNPYENSREQFLKKHNITEHYDVNASIARMVRARYFGVIDNLSEDLYKTIYGSIFDSWNKETRQYVKDKNMRMIFGGSYNNIIAKHRWSNKLTNKPELSDNEIEILKNMKLLEEAFIGNPNFYTSCFLDESCVYALFKNKLESMGIEVYQCYDGFYMSYKPENIEEILIDSMLEYFNDVCGLEVRYAG